MPSGLFYINCLPEPVHFQWKECVFNFHYHPLLNGTSLDPDQSPRSVASDLGLHFS